MALTISKPHKLTLPVMRTRVWWQIFYDRLYVELLESSVKVRCRDADSIIAGWLLAAGCWLLASTCSYVGRFRQIQADSGRY